MLFKFFSSDISICISLIFALKSSWVELAVPSIVSLSTLNILNFSLWTPFSVVIGHQYWLNLLIMVLVLVSNCFFPNVIDTLPHCQKIYVGERLSLGYISSCQFRRPQPWVWLLSGLSFMFLCTMTILYSQVQTWLNSDLHYGFIILMNNIFY